MVLGQLPGLLDVRNMILGGGQLRFGAEQALFDELSPHGEVGQSALGDCLGRLFELADEIGEQRCLAGKAAGAG